MTVDGESWPLPRPHLVIATQNPRSQLGTFPLVESQLDRFAVATSIGYPDAAQEAELVLHAGGTYALAELQAVCTAEEWLRRAAGRRGGAGRARGGGLRRGDLRASRRAPGVYLGASPRASIWLVRAAQARAILAARGLRGARRRQGDGAAVPGAPDPHVGGRREHGAGGGRGPHAPRHDARPALVSRWPRPARPWTPILGAVAVVGIWWLVAHNGGAGWVQFVGDLVFGALLVGVAGPAVAVGRARLEVRRRAGRRRPRPARRAPRRRLDPPAGPAAGAAGGRGLPRPGPAGRADRRPHGGAGATRRAHVRDARRGVGGAVRPAVVAPAGDAAAAPGAPRGAASGPPRPAAAPARSRRGPWCPATRRRRLPPWGAALRPRGRPSPGALARHGAHRRPDGQGARAAGGSAGHGGGRPPGRPRRGRARRGARPRHGGRAAGRGRHRPAADARALGGRDTPGGGPPPGPAPPGPRRRPRTTPATAATPSRRERPRGHPQGQPPRGARGLRPPARRVLGRRRGRPRGVHLVGRGLHGDGVGRARPRLARHGVLVPDPGAAARLDQGRGGGRRRGGVGVVLPRGERGVERLRHGGEPLDVPVGGGAGRPLLPRAGAPRPPVLARRLGGPDGGGGRAGDRPAVRPLRGGLGRLLPVGPVGDVDLGERGRADLGAEPGLRAGCPQRRRGRRLPRAPRAGRGGPARLPVQGRRRGVRGRAGRAGGGRGDAGPAGSAPGAPPGRRRVGGYLGFAQTLDTAFAGS